MKRTFLIPSLLAAGFLPTKAVVPNPPKESQDKQPTLFDLYKLGHKYNLAAHRSHSSHSSHRSHRSSSGGGYTAPRVSPGPQQTAPSRNNNSTPPTSILPSPPAVAPPVFVPSPPAADSIAPGGVLPVLPGNSEKFKEIVRQVQTAMYVYGYYTGAIDGLVGPQTRAALSKLQADYGLTVTGTITPEVLNALQVSAQ